MTQDALQIAKRYRKNAGAGSKAMEMTQERNKNTTEAGFAIWNCCAKKNGQAIEP